MDSATLPKLVDELIELLRGKTIIESVAFLHKGKIISERFFDFSFLDYVTWAYELSRIFAQSNSFQRETSFEDINWFQNNVNQGIRKSGVLEKDKDGFRLLYPGIYYYTVYESFWWGLWVLSSLGASLLDKGDGNGRS